MNTRRALIAAVGLFVIAALAGVTALLFPSNSLAIKVFSSSLLFGGFAICVLVDTIVIGKRRVVPLMYLAIACAIVSFIAWTLFVWEILDPQINLARVFASLTTVAVALPIVGLLALPRLSTSFARWMRFVTIASISITAGLIITAFWEIWPDDAQDALMRCIGIGSVVAAAGIICTPILYKLQSTRPSEQILRPIPIRLTCPRCAAQVTAKQGDSKCPNCALRFSIRVEEPRCACGYPLYGLESDKCPECGRPIPESDRWLPPVSILEKN